MGHLQFQWFSIIFPIFISQAYPIFRYTHMYVYIYILIMCVYVYIYIIIYYPLCYPYIIHYFPDIIYDYLMIMISPPLQTPCPCPSRTCRRSSWRSGAASSARVWRRWSDRRRCGNRAVQRGKWGKLGNKNGKTGWNMGDKSGFFIGGKKCQNNNGKDREIF